MIRPRYRLLTQALLGSLLIGTAGLGLVGCSNDQPAIPSLSPIDSSRAAVSTQIDRMGFPVVNTVFIPRTPVDRRDAFNQGDPTTDLARFLALAVQRVTDIRTAVNNLGTFPAEDAPGVTPAQLMGILLPDAFAINFAAPLNFPNGRALADDVIDAGLGLTLNRGNVLGGGPGVSDAIPATANNTFLMAFPYLGTPN